MLNEDLIEMAFIDLESGEKVYHEYIYPSNNKPITNP